MNEKMFESQNVSWEHDDCANQRDNCKLINHIISFQNAGKQSEHTPPLGWVPYEALLQQEIIELPCLVHINLDERSCLG